LKIARTTSSSCVRPSKRLPSPIQCKLPTIDGFDVLAWIRQQEGICGLPVVVFTSSDHLRDVNRAYALGANSFFVKELDFQEAVDLSKLLRQYWVEKALKPQTSRPARLPKQA